MKDDGGPAFPYPTGYPNFTGMTLRDWFAGMALSVLSNSNVAEIATEENVSAEEFPLKIALACYQIADAMLRERSK